MCPAFGGRYSEENAKMNDTKKAPLGVPFHGVNLCLLRFGRVDEGLDFQDGLAWVGVGVDGDCFGLVVLLPFRVEFDFNLSTGAGCDWLLGTLRHRTSARTFALVQDEGLASSVGERENVCHCISLVQGAEVVLIRVENHGCCRASGLLSLAFGRVKLFWFGVDRGRGGGGLFFRCRCWGCFRAALVASCEAEQQCSQRQCGDGKTHDCMLLFWQK